ncbi:MAG: DCC1-like thiol-disulfide oxidoreductase family protein [Burkholderiaceae bacterium]
MNDRPVAFPEPLPDHLVVFDGVCVLCSGFARWVAHFDRGQRFRFATAQSPLGAALFTAHGLPIDVYEANLVLIDGKAYKGMAALLATADALGWPWRVARVLDMLPARWQQWLYDRIARNRYALFGRKDVCGIPSGPVRDRMIGEVPGSTAAARGSTAGAPGSTAAAPGSNATVPASTAGAPHSPATADASGGPG